MLSIFCTILLNTSTQYGHRKISYHGGNHQLQDMTIFRACSWGLTIYKTLSSRKLTIENEIFLTQVGTLVFIKWSNIINEIFIA